jgi:hypothetical protein
MVIGSAIGVGVLVGVFVLMCMFIGMFMLFTRTYIGGGKCGGRQTQEDGCAGQKYAVHLGRPFLDHFSRRCSSALAKSGQTVEWWNIGPRFSFG